MGVRDAKSPEAKERARRTVMLAAMAQSRAKTRLTHLYPALYRAFYLEEKAKAESQLAAKEGKS